MNTLHSYKIIPRNQLTKEISQKAKYQATAHWHFIAPGSIRPCTFSFRFLIPESKLLKLQFGCNSSSGLQKQSRTLEG